MVFCHSNPNGLRHLLYKTMTTLSTVSNKNSSYPLQPPLSVFNITPGCISDFLARFSASTYRPIPKPMTHTLGFSSGNTPVLDNYFYLNYMLMFK